MSGVPTSDALDIALAARRIPLVKSSVAEFAARHAPEGLSAALDVALPNAGAHAATVLAVAAAERGVRLDPAVVRRLLPELESITLFGPLALAVEGDAVALLIGFLDDGAGAWEREALAIALASELVSPPPARLLTHARKLARKRLGLEAGVVLGAAASRLRDPHLQTLAMRFMVLAKRDTSVENMLRAARVSPLDALPTAAPPRISTGYTVRAERAAGRNDPCPCGSGKKYKKCCADKRADDLPEPAPIDPRLLSTEQVGALRASQLAELDPRLLSRHGRIEGFRKLLVFRRWDAAERFLDAMPSTTERGSLDDWRDELVSEAIRQRAHDVVQRHIARLPPEYVDRRLRILLDCIEKPADLIDRLNAHARAALEEETEEEHDAALSLAFAMLDYFPALGVFVARGALSNARLLDSHTLLGAMEEARDELGIAPYEPWWDVWDQIDEGTNRSRQSEAERSEIEKTASDLRRARAQADEAATEAAYLQRRLRELEAARPKGEPSPVAAPAERTASSQHPDIEQEKKELRTKVAELQRIIREGQEERSNLRRHLASVKQPSPTPSSDVAGAAGEDVDDDGESVQRPRRLLIPAYEARASKVMSDLPAETAENVLLLVAELAAGREHAWRGVKRLRTRDVLSARAGIHYRVLFRVEERSLFVVQVTHRRDLEQAIASVSPAS